MSRTQTTFITGLLLFFFIGTKGQTPLPYVSFAKGIAITPPDSSFSINVRFRMQNRAGFSTVSTSDLTVNEVEARTRRMRLRLEGFMYSPKLTYLVQLSFARGDMDAEYGNVPNVVRDAYVQYAVSKSFTVGLGQTKLPGNRQRLVSSGEQQLTDRSIVNAAFNIDRDFGLQFAFRQPFFVLRGALSTGEGRNSNSSDNGIAYTGRVELLPLGAFTKGNDYQEGDLAREPKPKLAIAFVGHQNENATRTGGQLGNTLYEKRDLSSRMADLLFKYNGLAISAEYLSRETTNPFTADEDGNTRHILVGHGENYQLSYLFKSNYELTGRYSSLTPEKQISSVEKTKEQFTLGATKYLKGHRVKLQTETTLERWSQNAEAGKFWICRFQIEVGI
jgi:phosphate-selective porin OprO and OprP